MEVVEVGIERRELSPRSFQSFSPVQLGVLGGKFSWKEKSELDVVNQSLQKKNSKSVITHLATCFFWFRLKSESWVLDLRCDLPGSTPSLSV